SVRIGKCIALREDEAIAQHTTPPLPSETQIPNKSDHQKVVEHEYERVLATKRKAQEAKSKAASKRPAQEGPSRRMKKKNAILISMALSESVAGDSNQTVSGTHHSVSPISTFVPDNVNTNPEGNHQVLHGVEHVEEEADASNNNVDDHELNSPHLASFTHSDHSLHSEHSLHFEEHQVTQIGDDELRTSEGDGNVQHIVAGST
nr:hypothetical protein [Tanacetum cinerariifolium]